MKDLTTSDKIGVEMEQSVKWRKYPEHKREPDSVTGLPSRKDLDEDLPSLLRIMGSANFPMAVLMVDIDHFKKFNDKWGHNTGDRVLRHVSDLIRETVKKTLQKHCRFLH
jgi:diguanylate cyclase (GGDEF)-like protein